MSGDAQTPVRSVVIAGDGMAAWLAAALLCKRLPESVSVTIVGGATQEPTDILYGTVLPPEAFDLHLSIGLDERDLLATTGTAFAFGVEYSSDVMKGQPWVQAFHQPLTPIGGVPLELLALHHGLSLQDLMISAVAGRDGRFAHPPADPNHPLSRAEYGYLFDSPEIAGIYRSLAERAEHVNGTIAAVEKDGSTVTSIRLESGESVSADLFIDATGPDARLLAPEPSSSEPVEIVYLRQNVDTAGAPLAHVRGQSWGWQMASQTRSVATRLAVGRNIPEALRPDHVTRIAIRPEERRSWQGNVVAIGQAAGPIEPLTLAPMRRLLRDIERIADFFPVTTDMSVERDAYNPAAQDDMRHARLFQSAFFAHSGAFGTYGSATDDPKLQRKLTQYASRGYHVAYDHEPFDRLDWAILHEGLGRRPDRPDPMALRVPDADVRAETERMRQHIAAMVPQMPPHPVYISKLMDYLARKGRTAGG